MPIIETKYITALIIKIFKGFEYKIIIGIGLGIITFLFDSVYADAMIAILVLIVFDFITAIAAQKKAGIVISSAKVFRSAKKVSVYFLLISAGRLSEISTHGVLPILDETVMGFLAVTEFISILENIGHMGYAIPNKLLNQLEKFRDEK